jgi:hypothetical protein
MSWTVPTPIAVPGAAAPNSLSLSMPRGIHYVFWVAADGSVVLSRFPGLDPAGGPVDAFTSSALQPFPSEPARRPVPGTSRLAAANDPDVVHVAWVAADGSVQRQVVSADDAASIGAAQAIGTARPGSPLAAAEIRPFTFAWVTPDARLKVIMPTFGAPSVEAVLGAPGSVRTDTPIALAHAQLLTHLLWVTRDGTLVTSVRHGSALAGAPRTGWSEPAPIRDQAGAPAMVAPGDTLALAIEGDAAQAVWLDPAGALRQSRFANEAWGAAQLLLAAGTVRGGGPVRAFLEFGGLEVLFATPGGGIGEVVPSASPPNNNPVTLAGPTGGAVTDLEGATAFQFGRFAVWRMADGSLVHSLNREGFGLRPVGPRPVPLPVAGDVRVDRAAARCELRLRHAQAADAFWVRPDGVLGVLSGREIPPGGLVAAANAGWRWRAAALARPGLARTSPPGAVVRLPRDPDGFALLWVQPDGSLRSTSFDGTDLVETPKWRLPVQVAPPGSAAAASPAVAATPGPPGAPAGEELAFWRTPARGIGVARRDDADPTWKPQTPPSASARADSTLLAGTLGNRVTLVWVDDRGVPVFASKAAGGSWVLSPAPAGRRAFTVAARGRLVAAGTQDGGTRVAWVDVDGVVRVAVAGGATWGDAVQRSHPGVADASSLTLLQANAALAWVLPDGTVVQEGRRALSGPAAASVVLGSAPVPPGGTSLMVAMPDGKLGLLPREGA